ncbi:MAG TPA: hypothetical protein VN682_12155 [Terriglobales bacterium]|nr:hypothetical protein [Terriglobales bacterium]HXF13060.1 hypothetical protein [Terriglobales bacterium]
MDGTRTATSTAVEVAAGRNGRRRRQEMRDENLRYFLPKPGSSSEKPELGQEIANEGEVLVQAFKSGQVFYTLLAWKAVPEISGNEPKIVKQALSRS